MSFQAIDDKDFHDMNHRFSAPAIPSDALEIINAMRELALMICRLTPASRERSLVLTHLEEAMLWAIMAMFRNGLRWK